MSERREDRKDSVRQEKVALTDARTWEIRSRLNTFMVDDIRTKGWTSIPFKWPHIDMPILLEYLDDSGWLDRITLAMIPSENPPGTWDVILTSVALTVTKSMTKPDPILESVLEDEMEPPGMEPALPELTDITAETRFENSPKRCLQCDLFSEGGCEPLDEKDPGAFVCQAFTQLVPDGRISDIVLYREEM